MKNIGAKKRLGLMQGRGIDVCIVCGDDAQATCTTCGDQFCRDCKLEHDDTHKDEKKQKIDRN